MFCTRCGIPVHPQQSFCGGCGASVARPTPDESTVAQPTLAQQPLTGAPATREERLQKARVIVTVFCIIAGAAGFDVLQPAAAGLAAIALLIFVIGWSNPDIGFRKKIAFVVLAIVAIAATQAAEEVRASHVAAAQQKEAQSAASRARVEAQAEVQREAEAFEKMTPAQHLQIAKRDLAQGATDDQIADGAKQLDALKGTPLMGQGEVVWNRYEAEKKRAEREAQIQVEQDAINARDALAKHIEDNMLAQGYSVDVNAVGPNHTTLRFKWVLVSKAFAYQVAHSSEIVGEARDAGFKKMILTDGYDEVWTLNL